MDRATGYTRSTLQAHASKVVSIRTTLSAIHRLPPLLAVIRSLLGYLRARARHEGAAIAAREKERNDTSTDARIIQCMSQIDQWHISPEVRLEELERITEEWFVRGQNSIRDLGRLLDLIESKIRGR